MSVMLDNVLLRGCNLAATAAGRNTITIVLIWIVPTNILAATSAQKLCVQAVHFAALSGKMHRRMATSADDMATTAYDADVQSLCVLVS